MAQRFHFAAGQPATVVRPPGTRLLPAFAVAWFATTLVILAYAFRLALFVVPADAEQGNISRALYYHVPHAMWCLLFPFVNFAASLGFLYLRRRNPLQALAADALAVAAAEVTLLYTTICLVTGSLWGRAAWGIWWAWDARLTSLLVLWLLYVAYLLVRRMSSTGQVSTLAAVLSVFAAIDVPIVYFSIRWWRTQHPAPVFGGAEGSGMDKSMLPAFLWNVLGWGMWGLFLLGFRYALERRRQRIHQEATLAALEQSMHTIELNGTAMNRQAGEAGEP